MTIGAEAQVDGPKVDAHQATGGKAGRTMRVGSRRSLMAMNIHRSIRA